MAAAKAASNALEAGQSSRDNSPPGKQRLRQESKKALKST